MFDIRETELPGCFEITSKQFGDDRGVFINLFTTEIFERNGLITQWVNLYCSHSKVGALRGLHFQVPPKAQAKLVACVEGDIVDVVVDVRKGSPTYGRHLAVELSAENAKILYVPTGLAHGFCVPKRQATVVYAVSNGYSLPHDNGILWNSAGIPWPIEKPILSAKDAKLARFEELDSPFQWGEGK